MNLPHSALLRRLGLPLLAAGLLAACSGNHPAAPSSQTPPPSGLDMFVNTATGSDVLITGRLSIVALEALDRTITPDLLPGDVVVKLSDPFGEFTGPRLVDAPPGSYVAVHLLFASAELTGLLPDQTQVVITLPRRDFRLPLHRDLDLTEGPQSWFTLHHDGPVELVSGPGGLTWSPRWVAQAAEVELIEAGTVRVLASDPQRHLVDGELLSIEELPVVLDLSRAGELRRNGDLLDVTQFFAELRAGELMTISGWLDAWRNIRVFAATVDRLGPPTSEVRGEIVELRPDAPVFGLQVFEVRRDLIGLPSLPFRLTVDVDAATDIRWVPTSGGQSGRLSYAQLRVGMLVDVEWVGPAPGLRVLASGVEIHSAGRLDVPGMVIGIVRSVDLVGRRFELGTDGNTTFRLGTDRYSTLVVEVDGQSRLTRSVDGEIVDIELRDLEVGARVLVVLERIAGNRVHARLVRVQ